MATHSVSLAPDRVLEWSDREMPVLEPYCAEVSCSPSSLCDACVIAKSPDCDCCNGGVSAAVIRPAGYSPLAVCFDCALAETAGQAVLR